MTSREALIRGAVVVVAAALVLLGPVLVTVDGYPRWLPHGTTVGELVAEGGVRSFPGDLRDVHGGFIAPRRGGAQIVRVDGAAVASGTVLGLCAVVVSDRGPDAIEPTEAVIVETTPAVSYRGQGPVESIELAAVPGTARVVRGAVSGIEVSRTILTAPAPMVVRREPAWPGAKRVALTFDDGPWPGQTALFVAELQRAGVRATFFMVGRQVVRYPLLARAVAAAGMEIGAHSWSHKYLTHASRATVHSEIVGGIDALTKVVGMRPTLYRPAGGLVNAYVFLEARKAKVRVVMWTVDPHDYRRPGAAVIAWRVLDNVRPGSVVLMHDGGGDRSQTLEALRIVLVGLKARGYEAVTLSELYRKPVKR